MKTISILLGDLQNKVIPIGFEGENLYTQVRINCIEIFANYPNATVGLAIKPPVGEIYPGVITKSGVTVVWNITSSVLSSSGTGSAQLTFTNGDEIIKTVIFEFTIKNSLMVEGDPPDPVQDWIDQATEVLGN